MGIPAWIALMILGSLSGGRWVSRSWPFMIWSGRMGCYGRTAGSARCSWQDKIDRMGEDGARGTWWQRPPLQRQPRLRRIPHRDAAAARGGAERIPRLPRPAAVRQGQVRVRPVHGRAPQPAAAAGAGSAAGRNANSAREPRLRLIGPRCRKAGGPTRFQRARLAAGQP